MSRLVIWMVCFLGIGLVSTVSSAVVPIEAFTKHAKISEVTLAPDGKHLAMVVAEDDGMESMLHIVSADGSNQSKALRFGNQFHVTNIVWAGNEHIIVSKAKMEPLKALPSSEGELFVTDIHGKNRQMLFGYMPDTSVRGKRKDRGFASVVDVLESKPGFVLVQFQNWARNEADLDSVLYLVNAATGERKEIERMSGNVWFDADHDGVPRFATSYDNDDHPVVQYRPTSTSDWKKLPSSLAGYSIDVRHFDQDNNTVYALISDDREPEQLYRLDLRKGTRAKLAGRKDMAVSRLMYQGYKGAPFAAYYDAAKPSLDFIDKTSEWTKTYAGLAKSFPQDVVVMRDVSRDGNHVLFVTFSDRNPGVYYLLDRQKKSLKEVARVNETLKPEALAHSKPITIKTRDGKTIFGLYTAKDMKKRPLVVMPHGGPYGVSDRWGFDADAQFMASRGYGVLQVNYRGSGSRGQAFIEEGYKEWGGKIQDDIADGVKWAVSNRVADKQNVCIYGASFGGYSALMNPIRNPDMYQCAIGYVGVYDLSLMYDVGDIKRTERGRRYLKRVLGEDETILEKQSPAKRVSEIKLPVFLAHGKIDRRVPIDHYHALVRALSNQGTKVESLVIDGEAHGFYKPENRAKFYQKLEKFLGKHLKQAP